MTFNVAADAYDRFMGRYSALLSPQLADLAGVAVGQRVLDVGCGPGALTAELVGRLGADAVAAVDPSEPFVAAARARFPGRRRSTSRGRGAPLRRRRLRRGARPARRPLHGRPGRGASREMRRVTRPGGIVAACVWDHAGGRGPLSPFWRAALEPRSRGGRRVAARGRPTRPPRRAVRRGRTPRRSRLVELCADLEHPSFEEWWEPYTGGVGPAGAYVAAPATAEQRERLRERCRELLAGRAVHDLGVAWAARGHRVAPTLSAPSHGEGSDRWRRPGATACATGSTSSSARGTIALILGLFAVSVLIILLIAIAVVGRGRRRRERRFLELVWMGLLRTLDPGTMGGDEGVAGVPRRDARRDPRRDLRHQRADRHHQHRHPGPPRRASQGPLAGDRVRTTP